MLKTLLALSAVPIMACTPKGALKELPKHGEIVQNMCTEQKPCSEIQKQFLDKLETVLKETGGKTSFWNTPDGIVFTDSPPMFILLETNGRINFCIDQSQGVICKESDITHDEFLEEFKEITNTINNTETPKEIPKNQI